MHLHSFYSLLAAGLVLLASSFVKPTIAPPPGPVGPYLNGVFPSSRPGMAGQWELEDPLPGQTFYAPTRIIPFTGTDDILVLGKSGDVWRVNLDNQFVDVVLDIKDRAFKRGEAGTTGIALHPHFGDPAFPDKQEVYIYYRHKPDPDEWSEKGYNRLSKFKWDDNNQTFDKDSEEILIQHYDRSTWHNGGGMFFGPDGFLYLGIGDEGMQDMIAVSNQRLNGGLFGGVFRIDVDNDPSRSHPIIRQPIPNATPPAGWPETFTQGYSIPNDNPWVDPSGATLEEFYALGTRNPFSLSQDPLTHEIWLADVGESLMEEISRVEKADNLQWPFMEGIIERPEYATGGAIVGNEKEPYFTYDRDIGGCIIGGAVYHGALFPELENKYIFADYNTDRIMALTTTEATETPGITTVIADLGSQSVPIPSGEGITGVFVMPNGEILVSVMGSQMDWEPGKIYRLRGTESVPDPPGKLSDLGVFADLETLTPVPGIIPYKTNSPLWSDRAEKYRWLAIPNDGTYDSPDEKIIFKADRSWRFPEGTVFIKHFELPIQIGAAQGEMVRLETRFYVIGAEGKGYGLTYRWNDEGTEAFLLGTAASRTFAIVDETGAFAFEQTWEFPSREQCQTCHNANADYVLGVKTHQLNGDITYDHIGQTLNQLTYLNDLGVFHQDIGNHAQYPKAYAINDENAGLDQRVYSYLDANCASCHRLGGVSEVNIDLDFTTPLPLKNIVGFMNNSRNSTPNGLIVRPGFHADSELWLRDAALNENKMPPLAKQLVDEMWVEKLAEWIDGLPEDYGQFSETTIFPNPTTNWLGLRIRDDWEGPFKVTIYAMDGRQLHQMSTESRSEHLDLMGLPKGTYVLQIATEEIREVKRFVVY